MDCNAAMLLVARRTLRSASDSALDKKCVASHFSYSLLESGVVFLDGDQFDLGQAKRVDLFLQVDDCL